MRVDDALRRRIRAHFPALDDGWVCLENAGGSQVPRAVADAMHAYLLERYVQLGAGYPRSDAATRTVDGAHAFVGRLMGAARGKIILGSSTTALLHVLAQTYAEILPAGRRIVLAQTGHEANMGPWRGLAARGLDVVIWRLDLATLRCPVEELERLLEADTALVAFPHVSNLLGEVVDVAAITALCHAHGARVVVDGVAYAPHRRMAVDAWDVDWYAYSTYKVYGPHMAALYGRDDALAELTGPNHFFIDRDDLPHKFELGGVNHEGCAGLLALEVYLADLLQVPTPLDSRQLDEVFALLDACERAPTRRLVDFLEERDDFRVIGPPAGADRVGTVSFVHERVGSAELAARLHAARIAMRHGHMYAHDLCRAIGLEPDDGVARVSLVHYNTPEEIDRVIEVLAGIR